MVFWFLCNIFTPQEHVLLCNIYFGFHSLFIFHIMFTLFKWFLFKRFQTFHFFVVFVVVLHHIRLVYLYLDRLFLYKLTCTIISVDFFLCFIFDWKIIWWAHQSTNFQLASWIFQRATTNSTNQFANNMQYHQCYIRSSGVRIPKHFFSFDLKEEKNYYI